MRKRALRWAIVLTLALGVFAAPVAGAGEAPLKPTVSFWAGIEAWFQDLLAGWFEPETVEAAYANSSNPPEDPTIVHPQDGGGGTSTTDGSNDIDPNG